MTRIDNPRSNDSIDDTFLKLDCSNDPLTDNLLIDQDADGLGLEIDSEATTLTNYGLQVVTGQGAGAGFFSYGNPGFGALYLGLPPNAGNAASFLFTRDITAASTDCALVRIHQDNAGDDQPALDIIQDGTGNALNVTGAVDISGHVAFGNNATVDTAYVLELQETFTHQTGVKAGVFIDANQQPAGALSGICNIIGNYVQAHYNSDEDGSARAFVYGTKTQAIAKQGITGDVNTLIGLLGEARSSTDGTVATAVGVQGIVDNNDAGGETGNITSASSFLASAETDRTTGTILNRYGLKVEDITGGGNLTMQYGIYCASLTGGTTNYGAYIEDNVGIGIAAPSAKLDVTGISRFGGSAAGNYSEFEADGTLEFNGDATVWDDYVTPLGPNNWRGGSNNPVLTQLFDDAGGTSQGVYAYVFSDGDEALITIQMPHKWKEGTTIQPHIHFMCTSDVSPADNFGVEFEYIWSDINEDFPANSTVETNDISTGINTDNMHQLANVTASGIDGSGHTISSVLLCRIKRVAASSNNYAGGVAFLDFDVHYEIDTVGSRAITSK